MKKCPDFNETIHLAAGMWTDLKIDKTSIPLFQYSTAENFTKKGGTGATTQMNVHILAN